MDVGKLEYDNSCVACHGSAGEGDVPMAGIIDTKMPDITTLSKRNNGVFPLSRVYETIDGKADIKAHGTRDMPVWGRRYSMDTAEYYFDMDYDAEKVVRSRLLAIAEYIYRLQEKQRLRRGTDVECRI